jgi:RND family efflux transporter MFP subunit
LWAHGDHPALPSKGATVAGDQLLLSQAAEKVIDLETTEVFLETIRRAVRANGEVVLPWQQHALVTTLLSGQVREVNVKPGDHVEAGETLATIDSLALDTLYLEMLEHHADVVLHEQAVARRSMLVGQGVVTGRDLADSQRQLAESQVRLEIASCKLRALGISDAQLDEARVAGQPIEALRLTSAIAGTVSHVDVQPGELVETNEHLFDVIDASLVWIVVEVLETDLDGVRLGMPTTARVTALPDEVFEGRIEYLRMEIVPKTRTRQVIIALDNRDGKLRPGMFAEVELEVERRDDAIVCPAEAIVRAASDYFVLLRRGKNKYVRRTVEVGLRADGDVEILKGLFPGDQVVTQGVHVLGALFGAAPELDAAVATQAVGADASGQRVRTLGRVEIPTGQKRFAGSRVTGRLASIQVEHGQWINRGDVLATIDSLELRNVQGELLEALSRSAWAERRIGQLRTLGGVGTRGKRELWELETESLTLANRTATLGRKLRLIGLSDEEIERLTRLKLLDSDCEVNLARSVSVVAPMDGWVAGFELIPGQAINRDQSLFEIQNLASVWIHAHLFQEDARHVAVGQVAEVSFPAFPGKTLNGSVVRIAPMEETGARVVPLWIEIDNSESLLIEGLTAEVAIEHVSAPLQVSQR